jgi:hypothetical protein
MGVGEMKTKEEKIFKYTKDGKKVEIISQINNLQFIVREVFFSGDKEFTAGENLVVNCLLDEPAESFLQRQEKSLQRRIEEQNKEIEESKQKLAKLGETFDRKYLITKILKSYQDIDINEMKTFVDFITGKIKYVVFVDWKSYEIVDFEEAIAEKGKNRLEGLKLITLFGVNKALERKFDTNKKIELNWRINQYSDGSGSSTGIHPFNNYKEAVSFVAERIKKEIKEGITQNRVNGLSRSITNAQKYNIKIASKDVKCIINFEKEELKKQIATKKKEKTELKKRLQSLSQNCRKTKEQVCPT